MNIFSSKNYAFSEAFNLFTSLTRNKNAYNIYIAKYFHYLQIFIKEIKVPARYYHITGKT